MPVRDPRTGRLMGYAEGEGEQPPLTATASVGKALTVVGGSLLFLRILQKLGGS
jgi:hypothetical protein